MTSRRVKRAKTWAHDNGVTLIWLNIFEVFLLVYLVFVK